MLRPEYLQTVADPVVAIFSQVEQSIADDIARRIVKAGYMTETAKWQYQKAKEMGFFREDVNKYLASATGKSKKEIIAMMKQAGLSSLAYDDAIYKIAGLTPMAITDSPSMMSILLQGTNDTLALIGNFTQTTAISSTKALNNTLDKTFIQIISGAFDPVTAIKGAITEVASQGIQKLAYPSGAVSSLEAGVRRAIVTGINQAVSKLQLERADEMQCELVETSSHSGARPSHSEWQGQIFCINGSHPKYGDFYDETGYGTGEGLCGWNCYHSFYPYFEGLSTPSFSSDGGVMTEDGEYLSNDEVYELSQKQRYYERQVRAAKKECSTYNAAMDAAENDGLKDELYKEFQRASVKLKNREAKLEAFVSEHSRTRRRDLEWTAGWNRSVSAKAVWANKKA